MGLAEAEFAQDQRRHQDLYDLCSALERAAKVLEAGADELCRKCGMVEMVTDLTFTTEPESGSAADRFRKAPRR